MTNDTVPQTTSIPEALIDPRPGLDSALATATTLIEAVESADLDRATPCSEMDVRALLGHLVMVAQRIACAARLVPVHEWPAEVTGLPDDAWAPAWRAAASDAVDAWSDDSLLDPDVVLPWATMPGRDVVGTYTNEVVVHTWDLAEALGQSPTWEQLALEVADAAIRIQLPDADRSAMWSAAAASMPPEIPWEDPFANAVAIDDDAPLVERIVAWNGRQP